MSDYGYYIILGLIFLMVIIAIYADRVEKSRKALKKEASEIKSDTASTNAKPASTLPPTPAPTPAPRKNTWGWVLGLVVIGLLIYITINKPTPAPTPQPTTVKIGPQFNAKARLIGEQSKGVVESDNHVEIRNGGKALFFIEVPQEFRGKAYFKGNISRLYPGELKLLVNGKEYQNMHKGGGRFRKSFGFPASELHSGTNTFVLSSPGENIFADRMELEIE